MLKHELALIFVSIGKFESWNIFYGKKETPSTPKGGLVKISCHWLFEVES